MVILLGGASCSGKTSMAQRLLERYHIPYLSIDHIKMGLIRGNQYCDFSAADTDDSLTDKLWPIVKGIVMTNIENDQNIIIEGCYIPQALVTDFDSEYLVHIIPLYIGFSENYLRNHFVTGIINHRSEIEYKDVDEYMNVDNFIIMNQNQRERCQAYNIPYFEVKENYDENLKIAYDWLDDQIKSKINETFNL